MRMSILIFGLPGAGKTTLAEKVRNNITGFNPALWINGDDIRAKHNDWDFSREGRVRQAQRIRMAADDAQRDGHVAICDFVCPFEETRSIIEADISVWVDRIQESRFADTNQVFETPNENEYHLRLPSEFDPDHWARIITDMAYTFMKKDEQMEKYKEPDWDELERELDGQIIKENNQ